MTKMKFLNITLDNITMDESLNKIDRLIFERKNSYIVTPNIDHIVMLEKDKHFKDAYNNAALVLADGQPLIWISKMLGSKIKEKVSGSDLFPKVCELAAKKGYTVYILGAAKGVAEKAAQNLIKKFNNLKVVGTFSPSYGFESDCKEIEEVIRNINKVKPDILAVSLGAPKSEKFILKYRERLNVPLSMSIGASVDFEANKIRRAPRWMSRAGLEWLYRMMREPKRLGKRYCRDAWNIIPIIMRYK